MARRRIRLSQAMTIPLEFGLVFGLLRALDVPREGYLYGAAAGVAIATIILLSETAREMAPSLIGITLGITVGAILDDPCSPAGLFVGPLVGFCSLRALRAWIWPRAVVKPVLCEDP